MPNQFQGFCYESQLEAVSADMAQSPMSVDVGLVSALSEIVIDTTVVQMTYSYKPASSVAATTFTHTRVYPLCASVGQLSNNSGVSVTDALTVSWLVVAVWAVAFYFRTARMGVRGY